MKQFLIAGSGLFLFIVAFHTDPCGYSAQYMGHKTAAILQQVVYYVKLNMLILLIKDSSICS